MIKTKLSTYLSIFLLIFTGAQDCAMDEWDYEQNPKLPYTFNHLDLDLTIEPDQEVVKGVATYSLSAKLPGQTQVILHAAALEIDAVTFDGNDTEYTISGDSLIISLADTLSMTSESELRITWQGRSVYGTHKDRFGTMWSSLNPKALRHWLPVYDHPRVEFSVDADITVPGNLEVAFNGNLIDDQVTSAEQKTLSWKVDTAIPATGLSFAVGKFNSEQAQSGINKVRVFGEAEVVSEQEIQNLLSEAIQSKRALENAMSFEYPWEALSVVVLEDNFWDERSDAAGVIYLAKNRGSLSTQLQRGMVAQWFGQYHRTENNTTNYEVFELIRKATFNVAGFEGREIANPDSLLSLRSWNQINTCCMLAEPFLARTIERSLPELIKKESGVVRFDFYSDYWYEQTGIPFPEYEVEEFEIVSAKENSEPLYRLELEYNESASNAIVYFENISSDGEDLQSLNMNVFTFDDSTTSEVTFTGERDSVVVAIPSTVEYVSFSSGSTNIEGISFGRFPVMFLLAQLRSENIEDRKTAAMLLSFHTDNPDLQLALKDALDSESNPEVRANLLRTIGAFTGGATGTELLFMQEVNNDSEDIQAAALFALRNYTSDESVPEILQQKMEVTQSPIIFDTAKESFLKVADLSRKISATKRLSQIDTTGAKAIALLSEVIEEDTTAQLQGLAEDLLSFEYSYSIRIEALNLLLANIDDPEFWGSKVVELSSDLDPRIRLYALKGLAFLSEMDARNILEAIKLSEFDPRVLNGRK